MNYSQEIPSHPHYQILEFFPAFHIRPKDAGPKPKFSSHSDCNVKVHYFKDHTEMRQWSEKHTASPGHNPFKIQWCQPVDVEAPPFDDPGPS